MAFAYVNPVSALWAGQGLQYLLVPEGRAGAWADAGQTPPPLAKSASPGSPAPAARPAPRAQRRIPPSASGAASPAAVPGDAPPAGGSWRPAPPQNWPEAWRRRLEATRPGSVLWTYDALGADLCDETAPGRQERRDFLRRLLRDLGHPGGTHTFWPARLPAGAAQAPQPDSYAACPDAFWSGVRALGARGVVVLGGRAARAVGLPEDVTPPRQLRYRGNIVWLLWEVESLCATPSRYASMLALLRQGILPVLRGR